MNLFLRRQKKRLGHRRNGLAIETLETRELLAGDTVVMFNDHARGAGTHENATSYAANGATSGMLKDIDTGEDSGITLTTSAQGATYELITLPPAEGTDAFEVFDGFVFMSVGAGAGIKLPNGATYTHAFAGLDPNSTYDIVTTAVRGDQGAEDRWTHVTLSSADGFTVDHSVGSGVVTNGLPANEVALWTGGNRDEGYVVRWSNIRPGADGAFSIVAEKYAGPTPGFGTGDSSGGANGYGLEAIRLTEFKPNLKVISSSIDDGDILAAPPTSVTMDFSSDINGTTIDASDLLVDDTPATNVTIIDADTLRWDLPANLSPGDHTLSIAAGAMTNLPLGIELQPFDATFAVLGAPSVANVSATNITPIQAEIGGTVTNAGGENPALFVYWGDKDGGTSQAAWDNVIDFGAHGNNSGDIRLIESLHELTTYFYRAYAQNSAGNDWASTTASFTTPKVQLPVVANAAATSVTASSARLNGVITATGGEPPIVTVVYGDNDGGQNANAWDQSLVLGARDGNFSQFINGLQPLTDYFYTAFAQNTAGTVWAPSTLRFTTPESTPQSVVINEMHVDPEVKTDLVEFVELYNAGDADTDLSGWALAGAVTYSFPEGTVLTAGGYIVVSQNPVAVQSKFGVSTLGPFVGKLRNEGDRVILQNALAETLDVVDYKVGFPWPTVGDTPNSSMELIHPSLDNDLGGSWRSSVGGVTPGARNSVFATNAAPQVRQVNHSPNSPVSGQNVVVTAKITDPDGVGEVQLEYQLVAAGDYISDSDPRYLTEWTTLAMTDDGFGGDAAAGDEIYSVTMPSSLQTHRTLVRYRITAADTTALDVRVPYADDPTPNFAYYVYDGVPDWTGSARPGVQPDVTYSSELLQSVATYQLLTTSASHQDAQFIPTSSRSSGYTGSDYLWEGTFVYDGVVYDHIQYRARGGVWRFAMGKNMWKFDFNRGHGFEARDNYGNKYATTWDKINFSALIQQGDFNHRGEQGLFETVGFKMFNLTGVEASNTQYVSFRLVTDADEHGADQFSGDYQGLYLAIEQPDGNLLDEHGLPDGNFYKMEGGSGELNNQGPTQPSNKSDLNAFLAAESGTRPEQFWRDNLDLEKYYSYRAIVEGIHHYDIANDKNYFYYNNPETGKWEVHPWDLDLTWANNMFGSGDEPFKSRVADRTEFRAEYRNRLREIRDLLYNTDQGYQLIDEMASFVYTSGEPSLVDADRAMWDYNPILSSSRYVNSSKSGQGRFYQQASTKNYPGMMKILKDYIVSRGNYIDNTILNDDAQVPDKPQLTYLGPADYALNQLDFSTSAISGGVGEFAAMKWRIAEITDPNNPQYDPTQPVNYEITATWESDEITSFDNQMILPATNLNVGDSYRVRVRLKNSEGYWSHWSDPIQFIAGPATTSDLRDHLRISEIMYNPSAPTVTEISAGYSDNDDFEFVELVNNSADTVLDLSGVTFTNGINYTFPAGTTLSAGSRILVVGNAAAFAQRYGAGLNVAGQYTGGLNNAGERLQLEGPTAGEVLDFTYSDGSLWAQAADGVGASLELVDELSPADLLDKYYQWRASASFGGSPGTRGASSPGVVINEILSHTDAPVTLSDSVELFNTTANGVDIGGWYLSDSSGDLLKFKIPAGTILGAGQYIVFDEADFNPTPATPGEDHFAFSSVNGDDLWLVIPNGTAGVASFVDDVHFGATLNGQSLGRIPAGNGILVPMGRNSLGCSDSQHQLNSVVISEINYNPGQPTSAAIAIHPNLAASDLEFIEIYNASAAGVDLTGWRLRGGADFDFASGQTLGARAALVVVSFNPTSPENASRTQAFRTHYGLNSTVAIVGGYGGQMDNSGDVIRLEQPDTPPANDPTNVPHSITDLVVYDDRGAWPLSADGLGNSLQRVSAVSFGNVVNSWTGSAPNPGIVSLAPNSNDLNRDGRVDVADLNLLATGVAQGLTIPALDVNGDGVVDNRDIGAFAGTLGGLTGDANLDGSVSAIDLNRVGVNWLSNNCVSWERGDFTGDGRVDAADLNVLGLNWLKSAAARTARAPQAALGQSHEVLVFAKNHVVTTADAADRSAVQHSFVGDDVRMSNVANLNGRRTAEVSRRRMGRVATTENALPQNSDPTRVHHEGLVDDLLANWDVK